MGSRVSKICKDTQTSTTEFIGLNDLMEYDNTTIKKN